MSVGGSHAGDRSEAILMGVFILWPAICKIEVK